jgi:hypothetical protein
MIPSTLKDIHDEVTGTAHAGYEKTYKRIAETYYWPKMSKDIKKYIQSCIICKQIKHARHAPYGKLQPYSHPRQTL